ncbi:MAG: radical SAM protein [Fusobacterium sp.]|nr:radical SAM protein [Fusobacterium sp.]
MRERDTLKILKKELLTDRFSHIYVEKEALNYETTKNIIEKFKSANIIEIENYKEIFSSNNQNFSLQKLSQKLILAVKKENLLYEGANVCEDFENENFYYTSSAINCIYDCEYCYLQGVYPSANIVLFVNIEDIFVEIEKLLEEKKSLYLCISYDTDLLAIDNICSFVSKWYDFCKTHKNLKIELRTKSANIKTLLNLKPLENFILAFTLSPQKFSVENEKYTATFSKRLEAIRKLQENSWNIRLCIDPLIYKKDFKKIYGEMIFEIFEKIDRDKIIDVSIGVFRVSKDYLKKMRKQNPNSKILYFPYENKEGVYSYSEEITKNMIEFVEEKLLTYIDREKIFI